MPDIKDGPLAALLLALADEAIDLLQETFNQLTEEGDHQTAAAASVRLERISMLRSMVELSTKEAVAQTNAPSITEAITAYLQEHDPDVFPINLMPDGAWFDLETSIGISAESAAWLDQQYPGTIILTQLPRGPAERTYTTLMEHKATPQPAFIPVAIQAPLRDGAPLPHNPAINSGMPMDGEPQGMPGARKP